MSPKLHWHILINLPFICRTLYGATDEESARLRGHVDEVRPHMSKLYRHSSCVASWEWLFMQIQGSKNFLRDVRSYSTSQNLRNKGNAITHPLSVPIYKV